MAEGRQWLNVIMYPTGGDPYPASIQVLSAASPPDRPTHPPGTGDPPGIWGPTDPRPTPPISFPPGWVGGVPPGGWQPPLPTEPPEVVKPVPPEGGWGAAMVDGELVWVFVPGSGTAGPKK